MMQRFLFLSGICFLFIFCGPLAVFGQQQAVRLSPEARISMLTCGPGDAVFEAFGHTALRVQDPATGLDMVYNYGIFDFNAPNFYLNYTKGYLNYRLGRSDFRRFLYSYTYYNRSVEEQVLNLSPGQTQAVFNFLEHNHLPENREYYYDYFYDNCSTRPRDVLMQVLGDSLQFSYAYADTLNYSIRGLANHYLGKSDKYAWGELGINLGLGAKIDQEAAPFEYMYQPEFLFLALEEARLLQPDGSSTPLVAATQSLYQPVPTAEEEAVFTPSFVFWTLFLLGALLSLWEWRQQRYRLPAFDSVLFAVLGITGLLITFIWFFTNHGAAANNWNIAWAWPTHLAAAFLLFSRHFPAWQKTYFMASAASSTLLLLLWPWLPQDLHEAFIPLLLLVIIRSIAIVWGKGKTPNGAFSTDKAAFTEKMTKPVKKPVSPLKD